MYRASLAGWQKEKWLPLALLTVITLGGAALRIYYLGHDSLWGDEIWTAVHAAPENDLYTVITGPTQFRVKPPPLYFLITHLFLLLLGRGEFILRLPAALFGVLGIVAAYSLARTLFGVKEGLISAFLLSVSPFHIAYSQEARYYTLVALLSFLSLYCLLRAAAEGKKRWWCAYGVITLLALYTHLFPILFLLAEMAFMACCAAQDIFASRGVCLRSPKALLSWFQGGVYASFLVTLVAILLLYLPWGPFVWETVTGPQGMVGMAEEPGTPITPRFIWTMFRQFSTQRESSSLLYFGAFILGMIASLRIERKNVVLALLWIGVPILALMLMRPRKTLGIKYLIFIMPIYLAFAAQGLSRIGNFVRQLLKRILSRRFSQLAFATTPLLLALFAILCASPIRENYYLEKVNWRDLTHFLQRHLYPGDLFMVRKAFGGELKNLSYYDSSYNTQRYQVVNGAQVYFRDLSVEAFQDWYSDVKVRYCHYCRVWVLYTATERFDPRRELEHWLEREGFLNIPFEGGLYLAVNTPSFERGLDTEERISLMEDAVRVSPRNVPFHLILANLYLEEGRSEEALSESQEALKRVITSQEKIAAHLQLGRLYLRLGQKDAARAQFEAVLTISPNNPEARLSLSGLKE